MARKKRPSATDSPHDSSPNPTTRGSGRDASSVEGSASCNGSELTGRGGHQLLDRLPGEPSQPPPQLTPAEEDRPQHLRNREDPLRVADVIEDVVDEEGREPRPPLGSARGAQLALLA